MEEKKKMKEGAWRYAFLKWVRETPNPLGKGLGKKMNIIVIYVDHLGVPSYLLRSPFFVRLSINDKTAKRENWLTNDITLLQHNISQRALRKWET